VTVNDRIGLRSPRFRSFRVGTASAFLSLARDFLHPSSNFSLQAAYGDGSAATFGTKQSWTVSSLPTSGLSPNVHFSKILAVHNTFVASEPRTFWTSSKSKEQAAQKFASRFVQIEQFLAQAKADLNSQRSKTLVSQQDTDLDADLPRTQASVRRRD
jgi:hypothetical protein